MDCAKVRAYLASLIFLYSLINFMLYIFCQGDCDMRTLIVSGIWFVNSVVAVVLRRYRAVLVPVVVAMIIVGLQMHRMEVENTGSSI